MSSPKIRKYGKSAASLYNQMAAWDPDVFNLFCENSQNCFKKPLTINARENTFDLNFYISSNFKLW
jgi:hypothetical protein